MVFASCSDLVMISGGSFSSGVSRTPTCRARAPIRRDAKASVNGMVNIQQSSTGDSHHKAHESVYVSAAMTVTPNRVCA